MAAYNNKVNIQTPAPRRRFFDLSSNHLTSENFMETNVVIGREFPAGSKLKCNLQSFARLAPMERPLMGSVQVHQRAFFVPFRTVWQPFNNFLVDSPYVTDNGATMGSNVPTLTAKNLRNFFEAYCGTMISTNPLPSAYDYKLSSTSVFNLNSYGRHCVKILETLGYKIPMWNDKQADFVYSALPLLSFAKVYFDYYLSSQYVNVGTSAFIEGIFNRYFNYDLTVAEIKAIMDFSRYVCYDNDYFVGAWDSPISPNVNGSVSPSNIILRDITESPLSAISDVNSFDYVDVSSGQNTPTYHTEIFADSVLTQYGVDSLKALTNWTKRHQLVGYRVLDRYLADFGYRLSDEALKKCHYLGKQLFPIQFSDVMSNADTVSSNGAQLGSYAGKGVAFDAQGNFEFETEEFGMFIIISSVVPDVSYVQGALRQTMHLTKLDFLNNEFEKLGTQPISRAELNVPPDFDDYNPGDPFDLIFGFTPRYAEYKVPFDRMTGDFVYRTVNGGLISMATCRNFDGFNFTHNLNFVRGIDSAQYHRCFYSTVISSAPETVDPFYFIHRINMRVSMRAESLYDTYEFDEEHAKEITMPANGTVLN